MESFLTTLPPYVHNYINKFPTKDCFSVLKELICFAVLYSNDRERMNLLSLELLQKGADEAVHHKPYTSSELAPSLNSAPSTAVTSPIQSGRYLSVGSISKAIPSPTLSTSHLEHHLELDCSRVIMEEPEVLDIETATSSKPESTARKSTMPYTFPEWWAHPDNKTKTTESPPPSNHQYTDNTSKRLTTTQEINITNWIPVDLTEKPRSRPVSLYNPTIPDLRSYLGKTEHIKKQENEMTKPSRQMSVSAAPPPPLTKSVSSKTTSTFNKPLDTTLSLSSSTRLATSSSTKVYRPGQTTTVRARAEQAKQRQLQLEEDKRKQAASTLTSRTSLRLRQQAASGIDWDAIKNDRRKTMPANGFNS